MQLKMQERFLQVEPVDSEVKSNKLICTAETNEDYFKYRVISLGDEVSTDYILPGDFVLAQKKDVNVVKYSDETYYIVSVGFVIKIEQE